MNTNDIIKALENERGSLYEKLKAVDTDNLFEKIKSIDLTILTMKQSLTYLYTNGTPASSNGSSIKSPAIKFAGYKDAKSNKAKAFIIVKESGRFLHMRQIREIAASLEGSAKDEVIKGINLAVYTLKNDGVLVAYKASESNLDTFWGHKNWTEANGKPKAEYMFDESELSANREEKFEI
jgi:hypothetical protein